MCLPSNPINVEWHLQELAFPKTISYIVHTLDGDRLACSDHAIADCVEECGYQKIASNANSAADVIWPRNYVSIVSVIEHRADEQ